MSRMTSILVLGVVAAIGCNKEPPHANGDGDLLAAGIPGAAASTTSAEQDSTPIVVRRVWGGTDVDLFGRVSPDGRYLSFIDWGSGNVAVREIATGETRLVTHDGSSTPGTGPIQSTTEGSVMSPDGESLCYDWFRHGEGGEQWVELRIVGLHGSQPRTLYRDESVEYISCAAWSPNGRHVVVLQAKKDGTRQIALVSVADGSASVLKELATWPRQVSFSPDSRYIVYDNAGSPEGLPDIFVLSLRGGPETTLVEHPATDFVLGWVPDGTHVLFASDRTGTLGAWLVPVKDGRPAGEARLVKPDLFRAKPLGFTRAGSFYYGVDLNSLDVYVATLDPETGGVLAAPTAVSGHYFGHDRVCDWSPDGRYLLYYSANLPPDGGSAYSIRSTETGETRQLVPDLKAFLYARWSPDGYSLVVPGVDHDDRPGVFETDVQSGETEPLTAFDDADVLESMGNWIAVSPDGREVYYKKGTDDGSRIAAMDLESGSERILGNEGPGPGLDPWALSPDGAQIAFATKHGNLLRLMVVPTAGGEPREVHRYESEASWVQSIAWSRDGQRLVYKVRGVPGLSRIFVAGGSPEKIGLRMESGHASAHLRFHPDGRRIAFTGSRSGAEVWVMENFLPERRTENP